ncbi:DNA-directed RNA polymerases IV and V subunit 2-like [Magnolia sinica]|uniref:DNA-directed RNA polymerases IV and V subunit 2-like n=1 Tax=Magnolia sinica TaxID=86752 RepID=UPI00265B2B14|nr:DNA-directed RNA polymerases IV and V subunit 2-like [Magnolia sinica]
MEDSKNISSSDEEVEEEGLEDVPMPANGKVPPSSEPLDLDISIDDYMDDGSDNIAASSSGSLDLSEEFLTKFCKDAARSFFDEWGLISHQINSYNEFTENGIQKIFDSIGEIVVEPGYDPSKKTDGGWRHASVTFGKVTLEEPKFWTGEKAQDELKVMPRHARLQNMTYSSRMKVEVKLQVYIQEPLNSDKCKTGKEKYICKKVLSEETKDIVIGRMPVMVKSKLCWLDRLEKSDCPFDHGGYFLIKGMEKTFIAQEERCLTRLWISNKPSWAVQYMSLFKRKRLFVKLTETPKADGLNGGKVITVYFLYQSVPIWIMFFALGASSDKEIFQMIDLDISDSGLVNILLSTVNEADEICEAFRKQGKALEYIDKQVKSSKFPPEESIEECINKYLFPDLNGHRQKALFLGYMVKCLLLSYSGRRKCDNRDDFRNKRLDLAGELLARELRVHIKHAERRMVKTMQRDLYGDRSVQFIERYLDASIITNGLSRAFSTGSWSHPFKRNERCPGIVATLRRTNPLQMMCDLRKTRQRVTYTGITGDARFPNPSYWGKVCFLSTPDGENCGLVKNLAVTGLVSTNLVEVPLDKLVRCGMERLNEDTLLLNRKDKVFLNGNWVGVCRDSSLFVKKLRNVRRNKQIDSKVEIKRDQLQGEVRIFSDAGRILRPLLIVENLKNIKYFKGGPYSFQYLLDEKVVELIGVEEEEDCLTAWGIKYLFMGDKGHSSPKYSHCELDLSFLLGLSCGIIPFANHNFARRVLYQSEKHSQQAIGFCTLNPDIRVDTLSHQLYYPQRPLFRTMVADSLGKPETPGKKDILPMPEYFNGQNAIVAVNVHQGYNQEDSLVMNRASLERGMFRTEHHRSYKAEVENKEVLETKRLKPKDRVDFCKIQSKIGRVDSLDDDGFPYIGANLQSGDIVIGKGAESGADHSIKLKHTERGKVQRVVLSANDDGKNFAVVSLRQVRSPCLGDKFSSMHGQKGVVGFLESQENFPFTIQGIVPDIVINPHAFPTRQTPGQLLEAALGKGIACGGSMRYATPFTTASVDVITDQLHRAGFSRWGSERVYNGRTGEMLSSLIFIGPTFYQRLIHMAEDKVKFRNTGPVHPLTRQPVADRKRFGGVKFGEMERDCLLAHGAAANLYERLFMLSDFSQMFICQKCTRAANVIQRTVPGGKKIRGPFCRFCDSAENIVKVNVPYGAKLLYQELFSMGICLKFDTEVC